MFLEIVVPKDFLKKYIWRSSSFSNIEAWEHAFLLEANFHKESYKDSDQIFNYLLHFLRTLRELRIMTGNYFCVCQNR